MQGRKEFLGFIVQLVCGLVKLLKAQLVDLGRQKLLVLKGPAVHLHRHRNRMRRKTCFPSWYNPQYGIENPGNHRQSQY